MDRIISYQCPNCEAPLSYTPEKQGFECEYCLSFFKEEALRAMQEEGTDAPLAEEAPEEEMATAEEGDTFEGMEEYACPNCGAEVACDGNTVATFCCYCHTPVIHRGKLAGQMKPHRIVPFQYDREGAKEVFLKFIRKKNVRSQE